MWRRLGRPAEPPSAPDPGRPQGPPYSARLGNDRPRKVGSLTPRRSILSTESWGANQTLSAVGKN